MCWRTKAACILVVSLEYVKLEVSPPHTHLAPLEPLARKLFPPLTQLVPQTHCRLALLMDGPPLHWPGARPHTLPVPGKSGSPKPQRTSSRLRPAMRASRSSIDGTPTAPHGVVFLRRPSPLLRPRPTVVGTGGREWARVAVSHPFCRFFLGCGVVVSRP